MDMIILDGSIPCQPHHTYISRSLDTLIWLYPGLPALSDVLHYFQQQSNCYLSVIEFVHDQFLIKIYMDECARHKLQTEVHQMKYKCTDLVS